MLTLNNTSKSVYKRPLILAGIVFLVGGILVALAISSAKNTNSAPTWSNSTYVSGAMAQVTALIRPSDGAYFFMGENAGTDLTGQGGGGGVFFRTNAASGPAGNFFNNAYRVAAFSGEHAHDAVFDRNSNLHAVWFDNYQIFYTKFDTSGNPVAGRTKLTIAPSVCGSASFQCAGPSITTSVFATAPDEIHVGFYVWQGGPVVHYEVTSTDGGGTWSTPLAIDSGVNTGSTQYIKIMQAPNGNVYAVIYRRISNTDTLFFARRVSGAGAWTNFQQLTNGNPYAKEFALSIDASSQPYILFNGSGCGNETYYTMRSTNFGVSFTNPTSVGGICSLGGDRTKAVAGTVVGDGSVWFSVQWNNGAYAGERYVWSSNGASFQSGGIYDDGGTTGSSIAWWNNQLLVGAKTATGGGIRYATAVGGGVATTPPAAPTQLTATYQAGPAFQLSWTDNSTTETNFYIERKVGTADWAQIAAPASANPPNNTGNQNYLDNTGIVADTVYQYRVRAGIGGSYFSGYSNTVVTTTPPAAPVLAAPVSKSSTSVVLNWSDVNTETSYEIRNGGNVLQGSIGANSTGYLLTGLTENTAYSFTVRAINSNGNATSNTQNFTTAPAEPTNLTIGNFTNSQVDLSWTDNSAGETGFRLYRKTGTLGSFPPIGSPTATIPPCNSGPPCTVNYTDNGTFTSGEIYYYRVVAYSTAGGNSAYSNEIGAVEPDNVVIVRNVTDNGDITVADSLSWAIDQANTTGNKTIIFQLNSGSTVTFSPSGTNQIPALAAGVKIAGSCDPATGPGIKIKAGGNAANNGFATKFDAIKLQAGAIAFGLEISGFNGNQIIAGTGDNATSCVKTSKAALP